MDKSPSAQSIYREACLSLLVVLLIGISVSAQSPAPRRAITAAEQRTDRHFESIRKSPPQMLAFLLQMPKGGDLHSHLSGAIYAESYIQWAADAGVCVNNTTMALALPPCTENQTPAKSALTNSTLYRQMIDAWSMRNWQLSGQSGHDRFFDSFGRFGVATYNKTGRNAG